ncbi:hypothetical protein Q8A64_10590 [Oxalobacteraceae bacterium R-40]|uniref:Uncharacterized protein n=1 Tax=Keguizhuia sedimenti TaxID=3064264 RepID=A0ABU1BPI4_9BURK|nr:hypothetical protein [Oxalobacteraceae bacterium R-40]
MSLAIFADALTGLPVSHVWRGHGSALFVEFGRLQSQTRRDGSSGAPQGAITLMIEWSWRIEGPGSILVGSWSDEFGWNKVFEKLLGANVVSAETFGLLPEIAISLSNGLRIVSFMTAEGQPQWSLISRLTPKGSLSVKEGRLYVEPLSS